MNYAITCVSAFKDKYVISYLCSSDADIAGCSGGDLECCVGKCEGRNAGDGFKQLLVTQKYAEVLCHSGSSFSRFPLVPGDVIKVHFSDVGGQNSITEQLNSFTHIFWASRDRFDTCLLHGFTGRFLGQNFRCIETFGRDLFSENCLK